MKKSEILVPVGNIENFHAALDAGADAVYLGLKTFNARGRASNFAYAQIPIIIKMAHEKNCKVYITLNTVIKNKEIKELIDTLYFLSQQKPDAVIIQDWGVFMIAKHLFPSLVIHASTQMANHNSLGCNYSDEVGIARVILARELTLDELKTIRKSTKTELEVFVHGALCYSFSGMCHFSSYLGGMGANRGFCTQPCRRTFNDDAKKKYLFNLKDNQQAKHAKYLSSIGYESLKIEGRLKSSDYVYRTTTAYKMLVDGKDKEEANQLLQFDLGREKTGYFVEGNLKDVISYTPNTGYYIGKIEKTNEKGFFIKSELELKDGYRIRIRLSADKQENVKVKNPEKKGGSWFIPTEEKYPVESRVYLSAMPLRKYSSKLSGQTSKIEIKAPTDLYRKAEKLLNQAPNRSQNKLYVRIDFLDWMRKIHFDLADFFILNFDLRSWDKFDPRTGFIQKYKRKLIIELPRFIPEDKIDDYRDLCKTMFDWGITTFSLSHISQKLLLPTQAKFITNENAYAYNDYAAQYFTNEKALSFSYPVEIDKETLMSMKNSKGIVPVYHHPRLFISRMPVDVVKEKVFTDDTGKNFIKFVKNGITIVVPEEPVSILQHVKELKNSGFHSFLIDLSFKSPSKNTFQSLVKRYKNSEQVQPSSVFNFKMGLT